MGGPQQEILNAPLVKMNPCEYTTICEEDDLVLVAC